VGVNEGVNASPLSGVGGLDQFDVAFPWRQGEGVWLQVWVSLKILVDTFLGHLQESLESGIEGQ